MEDLKIAIVAPCHIQPTEAWVRALNAATEGPGERKVIIIDDSAGQDLKFPPSWDVYTKDRQADFLGKDKYEQFKKFHGSSACKNIGHVIAWKEECDVVIGLDSDCVVPNGFVAQHIEGLKRQGYGWTNPIQNTGWFPRGYPYAERVRRVVANLGLWENKLDLGGKDRLENGGTEPDKPLNDKPHMIAEGFIPFSGMNWALLREAIPGLLFIPNFDWVADDIERVYKFRRVDDIWGGYIFQRLMEKRNERICYGDPIVWHDTIIDAQKDADEEEDSTLFENAFYTAVDLAMEAIEPGTYEDMALQFAKIVEKDWAETEWAPLASAYKLWTSFFFE